MGGLAVSQNGRHCLQLRARRRDIPLVPTLNCSRQLSPSGIPAIRSTHRDRGVLRVPAGPGAAGAALGGLRAGGEAVTGAGAGPGAEPGGGIGAERGAGGVVPAGGGVPAGAEPAEREGLSLAQGERVAVKTRCRGSPPSRGQGRPGNRGEKERRGSNRRFGGRARSQSAVTLTLAQVGHVGLRGRGSSVIA